MVPGIQSMVSSSGIIHKRQLVSIGHVPLPSPSRIIYMYNHVTKENME